MPNSNIDFNKPVSDSIVKLSRWMKQKRYSGSTMSTYLSFVRQFFAVTGVQPGNITKETMVQYNYRQFIRGGKAFATQNQWINAIKLYLKVNNLAVGDLEDIERPRKERKLPNVLSQDEVQAIFHNTRNLKHRALLMLICC